MELLSLTQTNVKELFFRIPWSINDSILVNDWVPLWKLPSDRYYRLTAMRMLVYHVELKQCAVIMAEEFIEDIEFSSYTAITYKIDPEKDMFSLNEAAIMATIPDSEKDTFARYARRVLEKKNFFEEVIKGAVNRAETKEEDV